MKTQVQTFYGGSVSERGEYLLTEREAENRSEPSEKPGEGNKRPRIHIPLLIPNMIIHKNKKTLGEEVKSSET